MLVSENLCEPLSLVADTSTHVTDFSPEVLSSIYEPSISMAVWQRELAEHAAHYVSALLRQQPSLPALQCSLAAEDISSWLADRLPEGDGKSLFVCDVAMLADMFSCLFDLQIIGLRLTTPGRAMCPRFHVDNVPCRLVTIYSGPGTQWLENQDVNRDRLGHRSKGRSDEESGLYSGAASVRSLSTSHVALLKGELWADNAGNGLVHRSPACPDGVRRLLLTLDFIQ